MGPSLTPSGLPRRSTPSPSVQSCSARGSLPFAGPPRKSCTMQWSVPHGGGGPGWPLAPPPAAQRILCLGLHGLGEVRGGGGGLTADEGQEYARKLKREGRARGGLRPHDFCFSKTHDRSSPECPPSVHKVGQGSAPGPGLG